MVDIGFPTLLYYYILYFLYNSYTVQGFCFELEILSAELVIQKDSYFIEENST